MIFLAVSALLGPVLPLAGLLSDGEVGLGPGGPAVGLLHHDGVVIIRLGYPPAAALGLALTLTRCLNRIDNTQQLIRVLVLPLEQMRAPPQRHGHPA